MLELMAAGAAVGGRALLQAADAALIAVGEDEVRAGSRQRPRAARWLLRLKAQPETTATALRGASSSLLAFAAVACAIVAGDVLFRAGVHANSRGGLQLRAGARVGAGGVVPAVGPRAPAAGRAAPVARCPSSTACALCQGL